MSIEHTIFAHLLAKEDFARKVLPFLQLEYFGNKEDQTLFTTIDNYVKKYNSIPTKEALLIDLSNLDNLSSDEFETCKKAVIGFEADELTEESWLLDTTEKWCQDKAMYNAIMAAIKIIDDKGDTGVGRGMIPKIMSDALAVTFDTNIGHDYLESFEGRFDTNHEVLNRIPYGIEMLNRITRGGRLPKTLNLWLAPTGIGKSLIMCNNAAHDLLQGLNVLYITLEMAEERIAERIDANLLNIPLDELEMLDKSTYLKKGDRLRAKTQGKLIIKEYPAAGAHVGHFRHMINELRLKKKFIPDIIYIDYLNLCTSSRIKMGGSVNTNTYVKAIAEEIRGLATELGIPIESATQTNRTGYGNSDLELSETSESYGLNSTVDFMCAVMQDEDMAALNQFMFKQLKSRYGDINKYKRFIVGVDKARMRLYDVDPEAQRDLMDGPVMDNTGFGHEDNERAKKSRKRDFGSFS